MGCYDSVMVPCPECGTENEFQSKGGDCLLRTFTLDNCPPDVMENINRHAPKTCKNCHTRYYVQTKTETCVACRVEGAKIEAKAVKGSPPNENE